MLKQFSFAFLALVLPISPLFAQEGPKAAVNETAFRFEQVLAGEVIEHTFRLRNDGTAPLTLQRADMTSPLRATKLVSAIPQGGEAELIFRLDTTRLSGPYEGEIILDTDDVINPAIHLTFQGQVTPRIEFKPQPMFFVSTMRDQPKSETIEIINHQDEPLEILSVHNPSTRFTTQIETLEAGKRYRLTLNLPGDGIGGRRNEPITLKTNSLRYPRLRIAANTLIKERVYTVPESIDFGTIPVAALASNAEMTKLLQQTVMIYQVGGTNFQIAAQSDIPFLSISTEQGNLKDRFEITVGVIPQNLKSGEVKGSIVISTNDPQIPRLEIPVNAIVEGNW